MNFDHYYQRLQISVKIGSRLSNQLPSLRIQVFILKSFMAGQSLMYTSHHCILKGQEAMQNTIVGIWLTYFTEVSKFTLNPGLSWTQRPYHIKTKG